MTCTCHSYNWGIGETPERMMKEPRTGSDICVDACIAAVIEHLWRNKVETHGCCCGHGRNPPMINVVDNSDIGERIRIWNLIKEVDPRAFDLVSWTRVHYRPIYRERDGVKTLDYEIPITGFANRHPYKQKELF